MYLLTFMDCSLKLHLEDRKWKQDCDSASMINMFNLMTKLRYASG
jgi:hypothetical protein